MTTNFVNVLVATMYNSAIQPYTIRMDRLIEQFRRKITMIQADTIRAIERSIAWDSRLIGIRGARGVGKTTLLLQHIKTRFRDDLNPVLYASLDNLWFASNSLADLADRFVKQGGKWLFLDEVHKYPSWSQAVKNLYDDYPGLHIVFTGSSLLEILDARADLSRRAVVYELRGFSFREFLNMEAKTAFPRFRIEELLGSHERIAAEIASQLRPLQYFPAYLKTGYYPYYLEGLDTYYQRLEETITMVLELELPLLRNIEPAYVPKLKKLLGIIAESAPFIPNISAMSDRIPINRQTLLAYLHYLEEAQLARSLFRDTTGIGALQKPDKLYLDNTNLMYLFRGANADPGNLRETFLASQLSQTNRVAYSGTGDFLVDDRYTIEVGGKNKTRRQIRDTADAWIASDDIEYGNGRKVPLWLFGFLY